ncbi:MAG: type 4a pilus biogenesis protein PilO, partial [Deltaproteobacteria bacterium]|nr:type 4a pilus biogenesis protein PilO [Deltaproteobacteria bacterium]
MKELIDRILSLPKGQKVGLLIGCLILVGALYQFTIYSPRAIRINDLKGQIETAKNEREKKRRLTANLPKLKQESQQLEGMLREAVSQLPDKKEIPELLSSISSRASEAGLQILTFRPRGENLKDFYAEIPVDIVVRGGFHNVVSFFDEVGRLDRLVNIKNIGIRNPQVKEGGLFV